MMLILKAGCVVIYALALAFLAGLPGTEALARMPWVAGMLLAVHALELLFVMKHVRRYPSPLALSLLLTLLFGLLHWRPLAKAGPAA